MVSIPVIDRMVLRSLMMMLTLETMSIFIRSFLKNLFLPDAESLFVLFIF